MEPRWVKDENLYNFEFQIEKLDHLELTSKLLISLSFQEEIFSWNNNNDNTVINNWLKYTWKHVRRIQFFYTIISKYSYNNVYACCPIFYQEIEIQTSIPIEVHEL